MTDTIERLGAHLWIVVRRLGRVLWEEESSPAAPEHGGIERARAEVAPWGGSTGDAQASPSPLPDAPCRYPHRP